MNPYLASLFEVTEAFVTNCGDDHQIPSLAIEVWNSLFEEETKALNTSNCPNIIKNCDCAQLANLFLQGLTKTGYAAEDDRFEDDVEGSISIQCATALSLLSQVLKDDILDLSFTYFE